jgi:GNAT superfamily N-acetyltransferase
VAADPDGEDEADMSAPALEVRGARADDLGVLANLLCQLHEGPPWAAGREDEARRILDKIVADPMRALLLGFVDGVPAGTVDVLVARNLTRDLRPFAVVENLIVTPEQREVGLGGKLMREALDFARRFECYKVQLVSANRRDAAHRLYVAMGFHADVSGFRRYLLDVDRSHPPGTASR